MNIETATFGAGCFWGVEETFRLTEGVLETAVMKKYARKQLGMLKS